MTGGSPTNESAVEEEGDISVSSPQGFLDYIIELTKEENQTTEYQKPKNEAPQWPGLH